MIKDYKDLIVWQKAMDLVVEVYVLVKLLPKEEVNALSSQIWRAAISIPGNIAEGQARNSSKKFIQFFGHCQRL
jgi:four helix bundle protein